MLDQVERRVMWKQTKWGTQRETSGEGHEIVVRQEERKYKDSKTGSQVGEEFSKSSPPHP